MIMEAHLNVLLNLKQAIMYDDSRGTLMKKTHGTAHIGDFIKCLGPIIYADIDLFRRTIFQVLLWLFCYFCFHTKGKNGATQKTATPKIGKSSSSDKFFYVDRKFFDRSG